MNRRTMIATVMLPIASALAFIAYLISVQDRLPDQVAIHWGPGGEADGFAPKAWIPVLFGGFSLIMAGLFAAVSRQGDRAIAGRPLKGMPAGIVWFLAALVTAMTAVQFDGATARDIPGWTIPLAVAFGVLGWAIGMSVAGSDHEVPVTDENGPTGAGASRIDSPIGHSPVWTGRTPSARAPIVIGATVAAFGFGLSVVTSWWLLAIFVPITALVMASSTYRVTIGRDAIDVSGAIIGFPRLRVPLSQVKKAEAGTVDAWSFGGWGIRIGANRESAVVTRSGPALVVTRTDDAVFRISLDDPGDAAAVLSALLDHRR